MKALTAQTKPGPGRNLGLDLLRLLCAFLIVCIHVCRAGTENAGFRRFATWPYPVFL